MAFEQSLDLGGAGLPVHLLSETGEAQQPTELPARAEMDENDLVNLKMMRVASSETPKTRSPGEKWRHLYGMHKEWKHQVLLLLLLLLLFLASVVSW